MTNFVVSVGVMCIVSLTNPKRPQPMDKLMSRYLL